jgi:hypothetical protein
VSTDENRRLALELDPIVTDDEFLHREDRANFFTGGRLSEVVEFLGWQGAEKHPEVRRFLDRLGAMVDERAEIERLMMLDRDRLNKTVRERDDAREAGKSLLEYTREQRARIEKALAWCDLADEASYGSLSSRVIRADLIGEEAE